MKANRIIALLLLCATLNTTYAQISDGSVAPNIVGTDIFGNPHSLYDYLGQGKTVILHINATWCPPCFSYHSSNSLQNLYNTYGPGGTNEVMVLMIEAWAGTTLADFYGTGSLSVGDFVTGTPYPILDYDPALVDYGINAFPTIFRVCPTDSTLNEIGQLFGTDLENAVLTSDCGFPPTCIADNPVTGLNSTVDAGNVTLSWDAVPNSIGCRVKIRQIGSSDITSKTLYDFNVTSTTFPTATLGPGSYKWRTKCACTPTEITPNTAFEFFDIATARTGMNSTAIWPNPATEFLQIKAGDEGFQSFRLINSHGKIVLEEALNEAQQQVDISELPEGIYYVELISSEATKVETIIVSGN